MADRTEEEQVEVLKRWFEENGVSLVVGIVLALGAVFGYRAWENGVREQGEAASAIYEDLVAAVTATPGAELSPELVATGKSLAEQLKKDYSDSSYAVFASMHMARLAVNAGDLEKAGDELRWALDHGARGSFETLARIRLARVLAARERFDEALEVVSVDLDPFGHKSSWEEVRGDIYYGMGRMDEARQAYQLAVNTASPDVNKPYLEMKLDDLTISSVNPETDQTGPDGDMAGDGEAQ